MRSRLAGFEIAKGISFGITNAFFVKILANRTENVILKSKLSKVSRGSRKSFEIHFNTLLTDAIQSRPPFSPRYSSFPFSSLRTPERTNPLSVLGSTSLAAVINPIEARGPSPVQGCVNPVCTPGVPCPQYRCGPTITLPPYPTQTANCHNPICTPGERCPLYRCAPEPTPTGTKICHNPICLEGEECKKCEDEEGELLYQVGCKLKLNWC